MKRNEATALFGQVYTTLSQRDYPCEIKLVYTRVPGLGDDYHWHVEIKPQNDRYTTAITNMPGWEQFKKALDDT